MRTVLFPSWWWWSCVWMTVLWGSVRYCCLGDGTVRKCVVLFGWRYCEEVCGIVWMTVLWGSVQYCCLDDGTVRKCAVLLFGWWYCEEVCGIVVWMTVLWGSVWYCCFKKCLNLQGWCDWGRGYGKVTQVDCDTVNTAYFYTSPSATNMIDITNLVFWYS